MIKKKLKNFNWVARLTKENHFWNSYHDRGKPNRRKNLNPIGFHFATDMINAFERVKFIDE
jgi:hypothetical protein